MNEAVADELNVVVTGGTPFLEYDYNTSALVRDAISPKITGGGGKTINIVRYPEDVRCNYPWVIDMSKKILSGRRDVFQGNVPATDEPFVPDLILHIGMRLSYPGYCFETHARREGFVQPGEDGETFQESKPLEWETLPKELYTQYDMNVMRERVLRELPDADIKVSDNAGLYFCEFQLLSTLAELKLKGLPGKAIFLHVPSGQSPEAIALGAKVAEELISSILDG
ncbi:uncharacterized protein NECHADRAFT_81143 [Fusarium vanettenii 77-13-4]|uniref:Uncharacterized protein n=1 Tax=Fusarium vanettenii (strain ATCC MYA-4622 / CBS 123669 / FGSC 9596 / NRRL 45880 / 77-13-4) TaxID=660122 RepID=C7ZGS2_FUSV7|nr:uncharacterized protein NECHADRAFT_81143 [Fusarium vanettenii 77-13-4]EEU36964.1 hypothetical protein NECHADRAFT_81143 [Fusarium vanettenii 77-13-4]